MEKVPKDTEGGPNGLTRRRNSFQKHSGSLEQFFEVAKRLDPIILHGDKGGGEPAAGVQAVREARMRRVGNETTP